MPRLSYIFQKKDLPACFSPIKMIKIAAYTLISPKYFFSRLFEPTCLFGRLQYLSTWIDIMEVEHTLHCGLLEHYYSVDFLWWFDRKISSFGLLSKTDKKLVKWQNVNPALCHLIEKSAYVKFYQFPNLQIDLEAKGMDGFYWKRNSIISVFTLFVAA